MAGQTGQRWYLWVRPSASVVFSRMAPGRGADVPIAHCAGLHRDLLAVVLVGDRYRASTCLATGCDARMLASGWAPVRRDLLQAARRWPARESWRRAWVHAIRPLYGVHAARLEAGDDTLPLDQPPAAFVEHQRALESQLGPMQTRVATHLHDQALPLATATVLPSLPNHWDGLTVCVERPEVAMDNHAAARALRHPVVGRKHSEGSGSVWSAHVAAMRFRVRQTVVLWGLNPHQWLSAFFPACADNDGKSPADLSAFLPWQMTPERREE